MGSHLGACQLKGGVSFEEECMEEYYWVIAKAFMLVRPEMLKFYFYYELSF